MIEQRAKEIRMTPIDEIRVNPKNRNKHPKEQIDRLMQLIEYQGFRNPLIVSNRTGLLVAGHGRKIAAEKLGMTELPVSYQDFDDENQEIAAGVSDNAIALWGELDFSGINMDLGDIGPDFDVNLFGLKNYSAVPDFEPGTESEQGKLDEKAPLVTQCPNCGECFDANENKPKN